MVNFAEMDTAGQNASEIGRLRWQLPFEDDDATAAQDSFRGQESESLTTKPSSLKKFQNVANAVVEQVIVRNGATASQEDTNGEASAGSWTGSTTSIQRFREVANTLAAEAIRRRRGLSEFALNQALSKLPSIWSDDEAQASSSDELDKKETF